MKKVILFLDIDLLDKDWLQKYPLVSSFRLAQAELDLRNSILLTGSFLLTIVILLVLFVTDSSGKNTSVFIGMLIFSIVFFVVSIVLLINYTPKYNKYLADKKAYEKKRAELRRQYDAL